MLSSKKCQKYISAFFLILFLNSTFFPTVSLALTSGPAQPEFSSFEPVSSSNMVDAFSGDFTYNLPLLEVPGPHGSSYPISLSYHSGVTPEEEASWVGYGWTLNAGAINRNTRGLPDDYKGKDVVFHNKMPRNWTATVGGAVAFGEVFGKDLKGISANGSIRYNNYRGFGYNSGVGVSLGRGLISMGYNVSDGTGSFSLNINPYALLNQTYGQKTKYLLANKERYLDKQLYNGFKDRKRTDITGSGTNLVGSSYGVFSYTHSSKPNIVHSYSGKSYNVSVGVTGNPVIVPVGGSVNLFGNYTYQENDPTVTTPGYGYLYSSDATISSLMDYHVEHEKDFNPRDVFLGVPFNDADNFMVSGEGIGGGFRLYNKKSGHFGPREMDSKVDIFNVAGDIGAGWTFGPGVDLGKGESTLSVRDWNRLSSFENPQTSSLDEPVFFRFNNDLGGEWGDVHNDKPFQAKFAGKTPSLAAELFTYNTGNKRSGRSSYIGYHLNSEMHSGGNPSVVAYSKIRHVNTLADRTLPERADLIGEISVFNESGTQYNYGLPVYNRAESNLSYSVRGSSTTDNYLIYSGSLNDAVKLGDVKESQYASTYLLTEILTPDYSDHAEMSPNGEYGASQDDPGAYTRFNYKNVFAQGASDWYDWRAPYKGLLYNRGSMSDPLDDTGGFSAGEKEIYYLHSIETKTHVAIFYTTARLDGHEAPANAHASSASIAGTQTLEKLDKIDLYTISDFKQLNGKLERETWGSPKLVTTPSQPKPVKTIHFVYDNKQSTVLPNGEPDPQTGQSAGKLTLKRVYFQYNGLENRNAANEVRLSPYEFSYLYPDYTAYPAAYKLGGANDISADYKTLTSANQNPPYSNFFSDAWGNYQPNGLARFTQMKPWVEQTVSSNKNGFDPAAWHLKRITLPSGGQIHIQYEQDDYSYVQDQEAHVMVTLKPSPDATKYLLDLASIGLTTAQVETDELVTMIRQRYVVGKKKMYFKILYSLVGAGQTANLTTCNADFITGYASVASVTKDPAQGVFIQFESSQRLPADVCKDFVKAERLGKVLPNQNCDPSLGLSSGTDPKSVVLQLHSMAKNIVVPALCQSYNPIYSYLRVPAPMPKKGGGVRVKRLLMFSTALEGGGSVLYGNEYIYQTKQGNKIISTGVATNEPQSIREENILTDFVARKNQSLWSKIVAGKDKAQAEGPLGESLLPGPSVGYSKVVIKNIHSGQSNPGFSVAEFYTAKDYPITLAHPDKAETMTKIDKITPDKKNLTTPFKIEIRNKTLATQGFSFVLNSMHGQPKRNAVYGGSYDVNDESKSTAASSTTYEYFSTGEKIPIMSSLYNGVTMKNPGREVDITFAQRKVLEKQKDINAEVDLQITIIPLLFIVLVIPYPTAIPAFSNVDGELSTHMTSKVIRYPSIVKKVISEQDGIKHIEENLAFDEYSGKPVAVRSTDEFKGAYLSQSIPASWEYKEMAGKWKTQNKTLTGSFNVAGNYLLVGSGSCSLAEFTTGDKLRLGDKTSGAYCQVSEVDWLNNRLKFESVIGSTVPGSSYTQVTIVNAGNTNQLQAQAGSITAHNELESNLNPVTVDRATRYETSTTNTFIAALKTATQNLTSGSGRFTLSGTYSLMDMSAFADRLTSCPIDPSNATVRNVQYRYEVLNSQLTLEMMSFQVRCTTGPDTWTTVSSEGWQ